MTITIICYPEVEEICKSDMNEREYRLTNRKVFKNGKIKLIYKKNEGHREKSVSPMKRLND